MESLLRNTDSTSITTMYSESGPTCITPQGTSRTLDHRVGPVGIHHIVEECRLLWKTGRRLKIIPAGLPRDRVPVHLNLRHTLQPQTTVAERKSGDQWDLPAHADCLQRSDKRVEFLQAVEHSSNRSSKQYERVRRTLGTPGRLPERTRQNFLQPTSHIQGRRCTNTTFGTASQAGF